MSITSDFLTPLDLLEPATLAHLDDDAGADDPVVVINLDHLESLTPDEVARTRPGHFTFRRIPVGLRTRPLSPTHVGPGQQLLERMATTLVPQDDWRPGTWDPAAGRHGLLASTVPVPDPVAAAERIRGTAAANPTAALAFDTLLRINAATPGREALIAESFAHAMLLAGADYRWWAQQHADVQGMPGPSVPARIERDGVVVTVRLPGADGRSGLDDAARAELAHALQALGPEVAELRFEADGPDFWAAARPDEQLTPEGIATMHLRRMADNLGAAVYPYRRRTTAHVRGRCIGIGLELAAMATRLTASPDAVFELPHLRMGLVCGHGGTVGVTRRIGRWRASYLALSATPIDAATALRWGLIDEIVAGPGAGHPLR